MYSSKLDLMETERAIKLLSKPSSKASSPRLST